MELTLYELRVRIYANQYIGNLCKSKEKHFVLNYKNKVNIYDSITI